MKYINDKELGYDRIRYSDWDNPNGLPLDDTYCYAHLPLVSPDHPDIIANFRDYHMGRYDTPRYSLTIPVNKDILFNSADFQQADNRIKNSIFAHKIAWSVMQKRESKLHVTVCGGLLADEANDIAAAANSFIADAGPINYRLGGPLVGEKNKGRIYFPLYPADEGSNILQALQRHIGKSATDIYLLGYYSLCDHLNKQEAQELEGILSEFKSSSILEYYCDRLAVFRTNDDLVLSGKALDYQTPA